MLLAPLQTDSFLRDQTVIGLELLPSGEVWLDGQRVDERDLSMLLAASHDRLPDAPALVRADPSTPHGSVIWLVDLLREAGFSKIVLAVPPTQSESVVVHRSDPGEGSDGETPPVPVDNDWIDCGFPNEAMDANIASAEVVVRVVVGKSGEPLAVGVVSSTSPLGFKELAVQCAMRRKYKAARNAAGEAVQARTRPFRIKFMQ